MLEFWYARIILLHLFHFVRFLILFHRVSIAAFSFIAFKQNEALSYLLEKNNILP